MADKKTNWDDIPALDGLEVEWDYIPENPQGKREKVRLGRDVLQNLLKMKTIPVRIVAEGYDERGLLMDLGVGGLAVKLPKPMEGGMQTRLGMFLGQRKFFARALVSNVTESEKSWRVGLEFVALATADVNYITSLIASHTYNQVL